MTTIAYKDRTIAYDSQATQGGLIVDIDADKRHTILQYELFLCGDLSHMDTFITMFLTGTPGKADVAGLVYDRDEGILWKVHADDDEPAEVVKYRLRLEGTAAVGSGGTLAMAAMDFGKTAKEAVKFASTRDIYTNDKVKIFKF